MTPLGNSTEMQREVSKKLPLGGRLSLIYLFWSFSTLRLSGCKPVKPWWGASFKAHDCVIAGGVESMSTVPLGSTVAAGMQACRGVVGTPLCLPGWYACS